MMVWLNYSRNLATLVAVPSAALVKKDLRCPLGESSYELVVVVYEGQVVIA